jgi:hypothetical protein
VKYPTYEVVLTHPDSAAPDEKYLVYVDLMLDEADALLRWTGMTWREWLPSIDERNPDALRFLYWLCRKRAGNPIDGKFSDISFWLHAMSSTVADAGDFAPEEKEPELKVEGADPTEGVETESN